jgi:hypothetical protein
MKCFMLEILLPYNDVSLYDHRYFYVDDKNVGHYACGLSRDVMATALRDSGDDMFLFPGWVNNFIRFNSNLPVLGFLVSEHYFELRVDGWSASKTTIHYSEPLSFLDLHQECTFYIPIAFNNKAIDAFIMSLDHKQKQAHLIPIQITIGQKHSDSVSKFAAGLEKWKTALEGWRLKITFAWISEKELSGDNESRQTEDLNVAWIPLSRVSQEIDDALRRARGEPTSWVSRIV